MKKLLLVVAVLAMLVPALGFGASFDATVSWTPSEVATPGSAPDGYNVYRDGALVGSTGPSVSTFVDPGLAESTQYCYEIGAFNTAGETKGGQNCATTGVVALPPAPPGVPTIIFTGKP